MSTRAAPGSANAIELLFERFLAVWQGFQAHSETRLRWIFFSGLVLVCGVTAFTGAVPTRIYGHDVFIMLDNGWRAISGQRPHVDFNSPWGPVMFLVTSLGLTLSHHSANGIGYGTAIVALVIGTWSFWLGAKRLPAGPRLVASFFLTTLTAAPYALSSFPFQSSHAMLYNRYGYALLGLILMESLLVADGDPNETMGGLSSGAALGLCLFLKASYFTMGSAIFAVVSLIRWRLAGRRLAGALMGFCAVSFCMLAYLRFDLAAMLSDLRMAAGARSAAISVWAPYWYILNHAGVLLTMILFTLVAALQLGGRNRWLRNGWWLPLLGAFTFFADIGLMTSNAASEVFPTSGVFAILVLGAIAREQPAQAPGGAQPMRWYYAAVLCLGALLFVPQFFADAVGISYGALKKARPSNPAEVVRFTSPNLRPLLLYDGGAPRSNGRVYTEYVNDGVALLQHESRPDESVLTIDLANPFSYALERKPPRGGLIGPSYHYSIDDQHRPTDEAFFGDAAIVMVPKHPASDDAIYIDFYKAYEPGLKQRYSLAAESGWWRMYRRKP